VEIEDTGYAYVPYSSLKGVIENSKVGYYLALRQTQSTIRAAGASRNTLKERPNQIVGEQIWLVGIADRKHKTAHEQYPQRMVSLSLISRSHWRKYGCSLIPRMTTSAPRRELLLHLSP
jgi:hypothetical protein